MARTSKKFQKTKAKAKMGSEELTKQLRKPLQSGQKWGAQGSWNAIQAAVLNNEMYNFSWLLLKSRFTGGSRNAKLMNGLTIKQHIGHWVDTLFESHTFSSVFPDSDTLESFCEVSITITLHNSCHLLGKQHVRVKFANEVTKHLKLVKNSKKCKKQSTSHSHSKESSEGLDSFIRSQAPITGKDLCHM
jgi:hypothetical protein